MSTSFARRVGEHPVIQAIEILMVAPPCEFDELVVGRPREQHSVAVLEVPSQPGECDDLGRADEREVLRVEIDDLPLAGEGVLADLLEGADAAFFVLIEARLHAGDVERIKLLAYGLHALLPVRDRNERAPLRPAPLVFGYPRKF